MPPSNCLSCCNLARRTTVSEMIKRYLIYRCDMFYKAQTLSKIFSLLPLCLQNYTSLDLSRLGNADLTYCTHADNFKRNTCTPAPSGNYPIIKSCTDKSSASIYVHNKHQNWGESVISASLTMAWLFVPDGLVCAFQKLQIS